MEEGACQDGQQSLTANEGRAVIPSRPAGFCTRNPYGWQQTAAQNGSAALAHLAVGGLAHGVRDDGQARVLAQAGHLRRRRAEHDAFEVIGTAGCVRR